MDHGRSSTDPAQCPAARPPGARWPSATAAPARWCGTARRASDAVNAALSDCRGRNQDKPCKVVSARRRAPAARSGSTWPATRWGAYAVVAPDARGKAHRRVALRPMPGAGAAAGRVRRAASPSAPTAATSIDAKRPTAQMPDGDATAPRFLWPPILFLARAALCWRPACCWAALYPLAWPGMDDLPARIIGYGIGAAGIALVAWGFLTLLSCRHDDHAEQARRPAGHRGRIPLPAQSDLHGRGADLSGPGEPTHNIWFAILAPLLAIALYVLAIRPEEQHLETRFGEAYLDYKERTRRWF